MDEVAASRTALQCLLESQDYAGSLELLGNLGHMVDRQLGLGIRAFKETRPQVRKLLGLWASGLSRRRGRRWENEGRSEAWRIAVAW